MGQDIKLIKLQCPNCGAAFQASDSLQTYTCNYCGFSWLVDDEAAREDRKLRARSDARARDLETDLNNKIRNQDADLDYLQKKRAMDIEYAQQMNKLDEDTNQIKTFRKGKLRILLIIFALFSMIGFGNTDNYFAKLIAIVQIVSFLTAWLMGHQIIKTKNKRLYILPALLGFVLIVPYLKICDTRNPSIGIKKHSSQSQDEVHYSESELEYLYKINKLYAEDQTEAPLTNVYWPDTELVNSIPKPPTLLGELIYDGSDKFNVEIHGISQEEFDAYINACRDKGYTEDYRREKDSYKAWNAEGAYLRLDLGFLTDADIMEITLYAPGEAPYSR